jgi:hypothetical protein
MFRSIFGKGGSTRGFLLVAAVAFVAALQGWKGRIPNFDVLTTIESAKEFVDTGRLPDKGVVTSIGSFTPPGAAWLVVPGVLVFNEPRLFEYIGSLALFLGTLCGIFLLTRRLLGPSCALLAVVLYGFSEIGLLAATTIWQRYPIHCFTVWFVYAVVKWVDEDKPGFLAGAILTWAVGMFVFMEMAPAILAIPVIWLLYRPSIRLAPVLAATVLALVIWYPYIRFEQAHHFVDLRSQLLREEVPRGSFERSWCNPAVAPASWREGRPRTAGLPVAGSARRWVSGKVGLIAGELLWANFATGPSIPGAPLVLLLLTLCSTGVLLVGSRKESSRVVSGTDVWSERVNWLGIAIALVAVVLNEWLLARFVSADGFLAASSISAIRRFQAALLIAAVVLVVYRVKFSFVITGALRAWNASGYGKRTDVLMLALAVPWILLFLLSDSDRRFWWLWPLQVIPLAAIVTYVPRRLCAPQWAIRLGSFAVAVLVLANPVFLSRLDSWFRDGWPGRDAIEVQVTDRIAARMALAGEQKAPIGYEVDIWAFMAAYNNLDARYKAGADLDLLLRYRHKITNLDRCAEGFSLDDQYRIVQTEPRDAEPAGRNRLESHRDASFQVTEKVGIYQIFERAWPSDFHGSR